MYLRGIVSFGTQRCGIGYPGVYINVAYYASWIRTNMRP
jgi:secreted trypsin-like serine protease